MFENAISNAWRISSCVCIRASVPNFAEFFKGQMSNGADRMDRATTIPGDIL